MPGFYERFDSDGNNTKYGAGLMRRRYVPSTAKATGATKGASASRSKAETEEAPDEERALRDFRLDDEAEESEVSTVRLSYGVSQTTDPEMGLRGL
ncbi:MAG: hypothetical protein AUI50_07635 [Crenarchaeota archaeon 13_1_40CM_2_52_14]|nr:MAG: hypothetical protein AUI97_07415 [Crenarchaeota archaeon 13_1_40CM_3_52_17]OLD34178.1 MAG: hypothetical protein AUI50_07635 [Crenarchaeota archaeon 13_1_40CM_2_52_14]